MQHFAFMQVYTLFYREMKAGSFPSLSGLLSKGIFAHS